MRNLFKKKTEASFFLVLVISLQFFFLPFYHLHPDDHHGHQGELSPHQHDGHVHSHELESLAHFLNLHPEEARLDDKQHHSHSSSEHDSDFFEVNLHKTSLYPEKTFQLKKDTAFIGLRHGFEPSLVKYWPPGINLKPKYRLPSSPKERSPPALLL
jgi:hypothetical protein